jgi:thiamine pyrophosphate-dependent acetolactate synthase large subunit-like protein
VQRAFGTWADQRDHREAAKSRTPLLVLAGDVPTGQVRSNFYIEQAELVRSVGAVSERIHTASSARDDTLRAATRAMHDRRKSCSACGSMSRARLRL